MLRYTRMVSARGYVHNTLGNMAVRVPHPDHPDGVAYTKHAGVPLEGMGLANIVVTDRAQAPADSRCVFEEDSPLL